MTSLSEIRFNLNLNLNVNANLNDGSRSSKVQGFKTLALGPWLVARGYSINLLSY